MTLRRTVIKTVLERRLPPVKTEQMMMNFTKLWRILPPTGGGRHDDAIGGGTPTNEEDRQVCKGFGHGL
jgi:hypothetical protein